MLGWKGRRKKVEEGNSRTPCNRRGRTDICHLHLSLLSCTCTHTRTHAQDIRNLSCPKKSYQIWAHLQKSVEKAGKCVNTPYFQVTYYLPKSWKSCLRYWIELKWEVSWWEQSMFPLFTEGMDRLIENIYELLFFSWKRSSTLNVREQFKDDPE